MGRFPAGEFGFVSRLLTERLKGATTQGTKPTRRFPMPTPTSVDGVRGDTQREVTRSIEQREFARTRYANPINRLAMSDHSQL